MNIETISNSLMWLWGFWLLMNHLVFKHALLKRLKKECPALWQKMGRPNVFSAKESMWSLLGFKTEVNVMKYLQRFDGSAGLIQWLKKYRYSTYFEFVLLHLALIFLLMIRGT